MLGGRYYPMGVFTPVYPTRFLVGTTLSGTLWSLKTESLSDEFKRGNRVSFDPCVNLWSGGHFDGHVWRGVFVPTDLVWSLSMICAHLLCSEFYRAIVHAGKVTHA